MIQQVLSILAAVSLFNIVLCHNLRAPEHFVDSLIFHYPLSSIEETIGRQMPPHHEPDAVLINVGGNGQPGVPGRGYPNTPGVFGIPRGPGGPNVPVGPGFPGVFGIPGFVPQIPGGHNVPGMPGFPNGFGIPQGNGWLGNPGGPTVYGTPEQTFPAISSGSGVFVTSGQGGPIMPNGMFGVPRGGSGTGFIPEHGVFGAPNEPPQPVNPSFGQPGAFPGSSGSNVPFPGVPGFFIPNGTPSIPEPAYDVPVAPRGAVTETFTPGGVNGFGVGRIFPNVFFPESSFVPTKPENPANSGGNFPRNEFYGGKGGREMYDDPAAEMFPLTDKSALFSDVSI